MSGRVRLRTRQGRRRTRAFPTRIPRKTLTCRCSGVTLLPPGHRFGGTVRFDLTSPAGRAAFDRYRRAYAQRHGLTMDGIDGFLEPTNLPPHALGTAARWACGLLDLV